MKNTFMNLPNYAKLLISIAIPLLVGFVGSLFTTPSIPTWYAELVKPAFSPPSWVFTPVWTILFILIGIAFFLVWQKGFSTKVSKTALSLFSIQLTLNATWSFLFFSLHNPFYAFIEIILLFIAILLTIVWFNKISRTAALLLIPYLLWVAFAAFLNYSIWILN